MSANEDQNLECPLCMEPLEMDDINFFPCTCGYQICRFCWHRIRTDENGLCPACRKQYPEDPADFKPLTPEEMQRIKNEKKQKDLQRKQKITENRKHLANVRVVQKNLVFVVGLPPRLADPEVLKKNDYFGKFGKIHKVVVNHSTSYAGSQGPSASAYVTYYKAEDALRAIHIVNNIHVDGRTLKASLGTTKYCSHFLKNQQCPKPDCMYLHELGDEAASFTKEEMQQGKHQEYEKKLHEQIVGGSLNRKNTSSPTNQTCTIQTNQKEGWPILQLGKIENRPNGLTETILNSHVTNHKNEQKINSQNNKNRHSSGEDFYKGNVRDSSSDRGSQKSNGSRSYNRSSSREDMTSHTTVSPSSLCQSQNPSVNSNNSSIDSVNQCCDNGFSLNNTNIHRDSDGVTQGKYCDNLQYDSQSSHSLPTSHVNAKLDSDVQLCVDNIARSSPSGNYSHSPLQSPVSILHRNFGPTVQLSTLHSSQSMPNWTNRGIQIDDHRILNQGGVTYVNSISPLGCRTLPFHSLQGQETNSSTIRTVNMTTGNSNSCHSINNDWQDNDSRIFSNKFSNNTDNNIMNNCTDWSTFGLNVSPKSPDDELGFDPWDESSKGLADLLEKEAVQRTENNLSATHNRISLKQMNVPVSRTNNTFTNHYMESSQISQKRIAPPPPGFTTNHLNNCTTVPRPPFGSCERLFGGGAPDHSNSPMVSAMNIPRNHHAIVNGPHNCFQERGLHQHMGLINAKSVTAPTMSSLRHKEWQDGLRTLLPNMNMSGFVNHTSQQPAPSLVPPSQKASLWNSASSEMSWMTQDSYSSDVGRSNSPPHWMKSLQQLTVDDVPTGYSNHHMPYVTPFVYRASSWPPGIQLSSSFRASIKFPTKSPNHNVENL